MPNAFWNGYGLGQNTPSPTHVYQRGPNSIREKATAKNLVDLLVRPWLAHRDSGGAIIGGHQRRDAWRLVRG
jgi:hypothetical protein